MLLFIANLTWRERATLGGGMINTTPKKFNRWLRLEYQLTRRCMFIGLRIQSETTPFIMPKRHVRREIPKEKFV